MVISESERSIRYDRNGVEEGVHIEVENRHQCIISINHASATISASIVPMAAIFNPSP